METKDWADPLLQLNQHHSTMGKSQTACDTSFLEEMADALLGAVSVYGMADVRAVLRAGTPNLQGDDALKEKALKLPMNRVEMMALLKANTQELSQANVDTELYLSLIQSFASGIAATEKEAKWFSIFKSKQPDNPNDDPVFVAVFDDENSDKELVYYIAIDTERKLLKVTFRGSVTVRDWVADGDSIFASVPNPLVDEDCIIPQSRFLSIHRGFHSYLFGKPSKDGASKYETIVGHLKSMLTSYPDYKIRVTGHSLGGALSTAFAFQCACDVTLPKPIACFTFASPRVGNMDFARAFQECELSGRLRHIRVVNDKDLVTTVPDRLAYALCCTNSIYRHVGVEVRLYRGSHRKPNIHFPVCHASRIRHYTDDVGAALWNWFTRPLNLICSYNQDYVAWHSCKEYSDRLAKAGADLSKLTLDGVLEDYQKHSERQGWHPKK